MQLKQMLKVAVTSILASSLFLAGCAQQNTQTQATPTPTSPQAQPTPDARKPQREPDVVYVPTPQVVVDKMLEMAKVSKNDVLYDLGSGDGRIVITAAQKFGTRGIGIEINPQLVDRANENAKKAGVSDKVEFREQDLFKTDFSEATVLTLYLLPELNLRLRPTLLKSLKPGTKIVSHDFSMGIWKPDQVAKVQGPRREHMVYLWTVPQEVPPNLLVVPQDPTVEGIPAPEKPQATP
jgi:predicted O-methyltransferase YrrM